MTESVMNTYEKAFWQKTSNTDYNKTIPLIPIKGEKNEYCLN